LRFSFLQFCSLRKVFTINHLYNFITMTKDKKTDYSKLSLGAKIPMKAATVAAVEPIVAKPVATKIVKPKVEKVEKAVATAKQPAKMEAAVKAIHATPLPRMMKPTKTEERTLRVTLDIPLSLHAQIRTKTFQEGISMKEYFLEMAKKEMGI
jgi:hypothetical protein